MNIVYGILTYALWTVVLFLDTDSAMHVASAPSWAITLGSVIGNTVWLIGILFIVGTVAMVTMTVSSSTIPKTMLAKHDAGQEVEMNTLTVRNKIFLVIGLLGALAFVGSGYWFTGPMWLMFLGSYHWYRSEYNQQVKKFLKMDEGQLKRYRYQVE